MKRFGALSIALLGASEMACSGNTTSGAPTDAENLDTMEVALAAPTGTVSATTAKTLAAKWQSVQRVHIVFDAILAIGTDAAAPCLAGDATAGSYDLTCLTLGQAHGRLTFRAFAPPTDAGLEGMVDVTLDDACVGDACVNAEASVQITAAPDCAALATVAITATFSGGVPSESFAFGAQGGIGRGALMPRVVYLDSHDGSFVVEGDAGLDGTDSYLVSGGGRSFECTFMASGGQCQGATSFAF